MKSPNLDTLPILDFQHICPCLTQYASLHTDRDSSLSLTMPVRMHVWVTWPTDNHYWVTYALYKGPRLSTACFSLVQWTSRKLYVYHNTSDIPSHTEHCPAFIITHSVLEPAFYITYSVISTLYRACLANIALNCYPTFTASLLQTSSIPPRSPSPCPSPSHSTQFLTPSHPHSCPQLTVVELPCKPVPSDGLKNIEDGTLLSSVVAATRTGLYST